MPSKKAPEWQGISRIDYKHTHGWFARVYLKDKNVRSKLFSDRKCGGKEAALEHARQWRDKAKSQIPEDQRPTRIRYRKKLSKRNKTGRIGVSKTFSRSSPNSSGKKLPCFNVSWMSVEGRAKSKSFFFNAYGSEEEAFQAACKFRADREQELDEDQKRQEQFSSMIAPIREYIQQAAEERQERLRALHALIIEEYPDAKMSMRNDRPTYERQGALMSFANKKTYISLYVANKENLAGFLAKYPNIKSGKTCLNFTDNTDFPLTDLRVVIQQALKISNQQRNTTKEAVSPVPKAQQPTQDEKLSCTPPSKAETSRKPGDDSQRSQSTEQETLSPQTPLPLVIYIWKSPKNRRKRLQKLHDVIMRACPDVKASMKFGIPTYEYQDTWVAFGNQPGAIFLYAEDRDCLAEFADDHPEIQARETCLNFRDDDEIPFVDLHDLIQKALQVPLATNIVQKVISPIFQQAQANRKQNKQEKRAIPPKTWLSSQKQLQENQGQLRGQPTVYSKSSTAQVLAYIQGCPQKRQERLLALHALILTTYPDVAISMSSKKPTYERQGGRIAIANRKSYISMYVDNPESLTDFVAKHPEVRSGKGCLNFTDSTEVPLFDIRAVIHKAFFPEKIHNPSNAPWPNVA
jgi:uncharacterized protein YdhG (YjbR/CyaY superfamily)